MREKHYKAVMSAFVNHELPRDEQQQVAEHVMRCVSCRAEHDSIKLGAGLGGFLAASDAPECVWDNISAEMSGDRGPRLSQIENWNGFGFRDLTGYAVGLLLVACLVTATYFSLFRPEERPKAVQTQITSEGLPSAQTIAEVPGTSASLVPDANTPLLAPSETAAAEIPSFEYEAVAGRPTSGSASTPGRLAMGDYLETDGRSKASITVANIGTVEVQPNSRIRLVGTAETEHRMSLEHGKLRAQIAAPPRLFIVDTPSATAVDLGCEYELEVDKTGNGKLHVTSGFVALERGGRESIVPAGAMCFTSKGKGLGTPFSVETSSDFRAALKRFDFGNGGSSAVREMLSCRGFYDMITLWHLLSRVSVADREPVFDALSAYVSPPAGVTKAGVLKLNKKMLESWRAEVERAWFD